MLCLRPQHEVAAYKKALNECATQQYSKVIDWLHKGILLNKQAPKQLKNNQHSLEKSWDYLEDIFYFAGAFAYFLPLIQSDEK